MAKQINQIPSSFDTRFLDDYLGGNISNDPITATIELVANAWDAGARNVQIYWPNNPEDGFSISDDGHGLSRHEFSKRWTKLSYNRLNDQGAAVATPKDNSITSTRVAYGRNGKGRFSAFCFGKDEYFVETKILSSHCCFKVTKTNGENPLLFEEITPLSPSKLIHDTHGTTVYTQKVGHIGVSLNKIRSEIGMRFLTDPEFSVSVNGQPIVFNDISDEQVSELSFTHKGNEELITVIHTLRSDKSTHQHGVAWHVNNRLVGRCNWDGMRNDNILDGRTTIAKKYTFIVKANTTVGHVKPDWSGFNRTPEMLEYYDSAKSAIRDFIVNLSKDKREATTSRLTNENRGILSTVSPVSVSRWNSFVEEVQIECPSLGEEELESVAKIFANLEASTSQYSLIHQLGECSPGDLDNLHQILQDWNIQSAKAVLDEIQSRLLLVEEIRKKVHNSETLEVQELQPLFSKGLWIFGPEFESIEFTSNQGMTKVLNDLFKLDVKGSRNRPDFVVLSDSSVGLYGCYQHDDDGHEIGIRKVLVVELKKPGIELGSDEKQQCWKYVKELYSKGAILSDATVECYLLGETIEEGESDISHEKNQLVKIRPLIFDTVLKRAETRLLNLHKKIHDAPFLQDAGIDGFLKENTVEPNFQQPIGQL